MIYSSMNEIDTHLLEPLVLPRHLGVLLQMGRIGLFEILDASNTLLQCFPLDVKLWSGMLVRDAVVKEIRRRATHLKLVTLHLPL